MTNYPYKDGSWEIYMLQSQYDGDANSKWGNYPWPGYFDKRELAEAMGLVYEEVTLTPSGRVWQESGIHGTTSLEYVRVLLRLCRKSFPAHGHRIIKMTVSRMTEVLE